MLIRKAYKFRLKPDEIQRNLLHRYAGHTRFLWNKALSMNLCRLRTKQKILYYQELDFWSKLWKQSEEYVFLKECPAHLVQQKLKDLERAFKDCFDKKQPNKRLPRFKKRGIGDSFRFPAPNQVRLDNKHITFPKLGRMKFYCSRKVEGTIKNYTVTRSGPHWYVCIQVEVELQPTKPKEAASDIGLDMGIKHFVSTSYGEQITPLNSYRQLSHRLAIAQRKLSKKTKYSQNWRKQQLKISQLHIKIANARKDFLHTS